jgi:CheY-like chemotaxis protein
MARILIIEDKPNQRQLYSEELTDEGYDVVCAEDGPQALELYKHQRPDLVVTDILLPGMTGIEVMERLLASDPHLPIIIYSAYSSPSRDFMAGLARAYVVKSGDMNELKQHIRKVLTETKPEPEAKPADAVVKQ